MKSYVIQWRSCAVGLALCLALQGRGGATEPEFARERKAMVDEEITGAGITDERVIASMLATPRHEFVLPQYRKLAYLDMAIPIGEQQTISGPFVVAYMTQSLAPRASDSVLEIGTGSGYQAAVLSPLVKNVYSIEIVASLGERAKRTLARLKYDNVHVKIGDGFEGWPEHGPFDRIIVTCSPEKVPTPLAAQLAEGGLMVIPVGERYSQALYLYRKKEGKLVAEALRPTLFVPMTGKAEQKREVKPNPTKPQLVNSGFEQALTGQRDSLVGWYYERRMAIESDTTTPEGKYHVTFRNTQPGLSSHVMQGFSIDGRKVSHIELAAHSRCKNVVQGDNVYEQAVVSVTFYDEQRKDVGQVWLGPWRGSRDWAEEVKVFKVPAMAREGIVRIGMFGATGEASFDNVRIRTATKEDK